MVIADAITKKDVGTQVDSRSDDGTIQREAQATFGSWPKYQQSCEDSGSKKTEVVNNSFLLNVGDVNSGNVLATVYKYKVECLPSPPRNEWDNYVTV